MAVTLHAIYRERKRRRFKLKFFLFLLVLCLMGGSVIYLSHEKHFFEFKEIVLEGTHSLTYEELLGNTKTISFFRVPKINNPAIASLEFHKNYLKRILRITIHEREPYGIWCTNACFWFDKEGIIFKEAASVKGALVRHISDNTQRDLSLGMRVLPPEQFKYILAAFDFLARVGLTPDELVISDFNKEEFYVDLLDGPRIFFSLRNNPSFAYEPLLALKSEFIKLEYIDLRVPQRIFFKHRK